MFVNYFTRAGPIHLQVSLFRHELIGNQLCHAHLICQISLNSTDIEIMVIEFLRLKLLPKMQLWAVPILLVVVAGRQVILVHTVGLSPWHGGGFGMFASIDRDERRQLRLHTTDCRGEQTLQILTPETLPETALEINEKAWRHLMTVPKTPLLRSFGSQLLDSTNAFVPSFTGSFSGCLQSVKIQVWRLHYSQASDQIWYSPVTSIVEVSR